MKKLLLLFIFLFCFTTAFAQTKKCSLSASEISAVRGLKLGMTQAQVKLIYPAMTFEKLEFPAFDEDILGHIKAKQIKRALRKDVASLSALFFPDGLTSISVYYDKSYSWQSAEEFAKQAFKGLKLADYEAALIKGKNESVNYTVNCKDFYVYAGFTDEKTPIISISYDIDITLKRIDKRNKEFKP